MVSDPLTPALTSAWAKTFWDDDSRTGLWLPLWQHLDDAGGTAGLLWDQWLPKSVRAPLIEVLGSDDHAQRAVSFLAGVHDVGKATPSFAVQARRGFSLLADAMRVAGLGMPHEIPDDDRHLLPHALAGQVLLDEWLIDRFGWDSDRTSPWSVVIGGHHGVPPDVTEPGPARRRADLLGSGLWREVQFALLDRAANRFAVEDLLAGWGSTRLPQPVQVLLSGLVIVADWIASNPDFFPLVPLERQPDPAPAAGQQRLERAWAQLALPGPWRPVPGDQPVAERLRARFDLPPDADARPVQQVTVEAATAMDLPGILVIEAPMGEGKTEAALLAAEIIAARSGAGGCFVALPTQATTDAMFTRVLTWLRNLPDAADDDHGRGHSVALTHGKAWLNDDYRGLRFRRPPVGIAQDNVSRARSDSVQGYVHGWTSGRKRATLADFVIGTIDQVLFTSLKARHVVLRHLGMARKVVVLDEVHAYDVYMSSYLMRALEWLGAHGTPVVLLSATLPTARRAQFFTAYDQGRRSLRAVRMPSWRDRIDGRPGGGGLPASDPAPPARSLSNQVVYPAVTYRGRGEVLSVPAPGSTRRTKVELELLDDDLDSLSALLTERLSEGGCALVVRNTVTRAQETADHLSRAFGGDVRLVHARFTGHDRMRNDEWLRTVFGPPPQGDQPQDGPGRPDTFVVVGTQVVEQSLDIDFDLLVTDLAPIDLVLQRVGRLHRHQRGEGEEHRPAQVRVPRCVVTGVADWTSDPPELLRGSTAIYCRHPLYRAAALITAREADGRGLTLPDDIAPLVEAAYGEDSLGPPAWQPAMAEALHKAQTETATRESAARTFQLMSPQGPDRDLLGWLHAGLGEADEDRRGQGRAQVRDGDDSVEVLLLRPSPDGTLRLPDGDFPGAGEVVPTDRTPPAALARAVAGCTVRLPASATRNERGDRLIAELEDQHWYPAWQSSPLLNGQLVLGVSEDGGTTVAGLHFTYDSAQGLEVR